MKNGYDMWATTGILAKNRGKDNRKKAGTTPSPLPSRAGQPEAEEGRGADVTAESALRRLAEQGAEHIVRLPDLLRTAAGADERENLLRLAIVR